MHAQAFVHAHEFDAPINIYSTHIHALMHVRTCTHAHTRSNLKRNGTRRTHREP